MIPNPDGGSMSRSNPRTVSGALAADRLGVPSVASFALTAAAPIMVVGGVVTTGWAVTGTVGASSAMLVMAAVLTLFCVGYVTFARHVSNAGSLYTYLAHGLGPRVAVVGSMVQVLAYSLLQVGLYGIAGTQAGNIAADALGVHAPWWAWALLAWALTGLLGTRGVGVSSRVLAVAMVAELAVVATVSVVDLLHPAGGRVSLAALDPRQLHAGTLGAALAIAITAFVGVEAAPVYSEESKRPRSTVLVATYLALALMTVTYVVGSWAITVAVGPDAVVRAATDLGPDLLLRPAAGHLGGSVLVDLGHLLLLTSIGAGLLSYHNAVARCLFALGRDGVLPRAFGRTDPATGAPVVASAAQTVTGLAVIVWYAVTGWDPMTKLFFALGTTGAFGVLILLTAVSVAVVRFFARDLRGESRWSALVAPAMAAVALAGCLYLVVSNAAKLLGVAPDSPLRWLLPASYLLAAAVGVAGTGWLGRRRPAVLRRVGLGVNAVAPSAMAVGGSR